MGSRADAEIQVKLVETNVFTRWPCYVCGGCTEKVPILAEAEDGSCRVCEQCLKAGDIDARLERQAADLERQAAQTRALIGKLKVPTYEEWEAACDARAERWVKKNTSFQSVADFEAARERFEDPIPF